MQLRLMIVMALGFVNFGGVAFAKSNGSLSDFIYNSQGVVKALKQSEAKNSCKIQNARLPSIRELAEMASKHGAELVELKDMVPPRSPSDFQLLKSISSRTDKKADWFYYRNTNYQENVELGKLYWIWSSSFNEDNYYNAYAFEGASGRILDGYAESEEPGLFVSARCTAL